MHVTESDRVWTVAEAKARLSQILRLAEKEGPQRIGVRKPFVVVPERVWKTRSSESVPLGRWLVENTPRGTNLEIPDRRENSRKIPFVIKAAGSWDLPTRLSRELRWPTI